MTYSDWDAQVRNAGQVPPVQGPVRQVPTPGIGTHNRFDALASDGPVFGPNQNMNNFH